MRFSLAMIFLTAVGFAHGRIPCNGKSLGGAMTVSNVCRLLQMRHC
ncbi:predicted protein [Plenodomus lingam JN3]|uniref:Predicted protein n=1 Tax=Leptosphaeria maculans (strain JN3 / isolate v23.1.3 / race Av1-4-5-6-7-8) TaxID=985895 RepID=E5AD58_LEPMJ|nr:predicted protein [Plenodomus lingam JN3]CBY02410.1 predicted protein [Plenodomus lingam JN3]